MKRILCAFMSVFAVLSFAACSGGGELPENQIINYNITDEPVTLDPQIANDSGSRLIIMNIFEGLTRIDENDAPTPGAAESWSISGDGKTYTFNLRSGICWSDGTKLTADDFVFGLRRAVSPSTGSETAYTLYCIKNAEKINKGNADISSLGITALDDNTIRIELEYPDTGFLSLLATPPAMPCNEEYFNKSGGQYGRDADKILSDGAFVVTENGWSHSEYIFLRKNTEYKGENEPVPAGVDITIGENPANITDAVSDGTIDCYALPGNEVEYAEKKSLNLTSFDDTVWGISFNTGDDVLKNTDIRYALLSSLDRKFILKELPENCKTANYIIPESTALNDNSYRSANGGSYVPFSSDAKKNLYNAMESAGIDEMPKLNILCTDDKSTRTVVNNIIESWNDLTSGHVNKTPVTRSELKNKVTSCDYSVVIAPITINGSNPLDTLALFESGSKYNPACLNDSVYDGYINDIKESRGSMPYNKVIEAENYLSDKGIFYPLYLESRYYASAKNVKNIIFHPYGGEVDFFFALKQEST